jgi:hypothetical protein
MVSSPDDANIPDLGSVSSNLGELSAGDANESLELGGHLTHRFFERLELPAND